MSITTAPITPAGSPAGAVEGAVLPFTADIRRDLAARGSQAGREWEDHIASAAGCSHPIRLAGTTSRVNAATGEVVATRSTASMPDGVIYTSCGNRRAIVCPHCAEIYRGDAYQLVRTGMTGGKGIPESVAGHPAVFATFTAPSFGLVHHRAKPKHPGAAVPMCRSRRKPDICPHGIDLRCFRVHAEDEHTLGTPLCLDCYDYDAQVVWNHHIGELWRRTRITIDRALAATCKRLGIDHRSFKLRYSKVAEFQVRGVIHFHAVLRLDGHLPGHPADPGLVLAPPVGLGVDELDAAVRHAVKVTGFTTEPHPTKPEGWPIAWGQKGLDVRAIKVTSNGDLTDTAVAAYIAKYVTKDAEVCGRVIFRLDDDTVDRFADPDGDHIQRLIAACWELGRAEAWHGLRRWAHRLGFGGHPLTKARAYSLTFSRLRSDRIEWQRSQRQDDLDDEETLTVNWLTYTGTGWRTTADALLAESAAARAREHRAIAREEIACQQAQGDS